MAFYVVISLCAFLITLLGTRLLILTLRNRTAPLDIAVLTGRQRPSTPGGGGIILVTSLIICLLVADMPMEPVIGLFLLGCLYQLQPFLPIARPVRLLVHLMAILLALSSLHISLFAGQIPPLADRLCIAALWLWFIEQFKAMDVLDGLCASQAISMGAGICLVSVFAETFPNALSTYGMIVSGAAMGFAWWNWHPAKIRMGESGSVPLGFLLGYLLLLTYQAGQGFALCILPAFILGEGIITGLRRSAVGRMVHYYERAVEKGRKPHNVVRYIAGVNILLIFLATRTSFEVDIALIHLALAYLAVCMLLGFLEHDNSRTPYDHA